LPAAIKEFGLYGMKSNNMHRKITKIGKKLTPTTIRHLINWSTLVLTSPVLNPKVAINPSIKKRFPNIPKTPFL